jgi:group I intron endonuclease
MKQQGIYEILNTKTNKRYIGSSVDIERRWKEHDSMLRHNNHHSIKLQRSYNKTKDETVYKYNIIEIVEDLKQLHKREQYYIDKYDSFNNGYNCSMVDSIIYFNHKGLTKQQKKLKQEIYYNQYMELYNTYKDNIEISKTYLDRMNSNYYSWIQYNKVIQLILEYEAYFSTKNYYIRLHNDFYIIATYERNPFIEYIYTTNKNKLELKNISKNLSYLNTEDRKEYEYK